MVGVPEHALEKYRNMLLNDNYTIVIVDQVTPPNPERKVVEIISTIENYDKKDSHHLVSLFINSFQIPNLLLGYQLLIFQLVQIIFIN